MVVLVVVIMMMMMMMMVMMMMMMMMMMMCGAHLVERLIEEAGDIEVEVTEDRRQAGLVLPILVEGPVEDLTLRLDRGKRERARQVRYGDKQRPMGSRFFQVARTCDHVIVSVASASGISGSFKA
jgi:hypothetical protein